MTATVALRAGDRFRDQAIERGVRAALKELARAAVHGKQPRPPFAADRDIAQRDIQLRDQFLHCSGQDCSKAAEAASRGVAAASGRAATTAFKELPWRTATSIAALRRRCQAAASDSTAYSG